MERLSEKGYWDAVHEQERNERESISECNTQNQTRTRAHKLKSRWRRLLSDKLRKYTSGYEEHLIWNVVYKEHIPKTKGAKVLEIGSAPGEHLVRLSQEFGLEPYGVDYSESGVNLNKEVFKANNLNPANVIHTDFFSNEFHEKYKESFDVVISRGFIEHFINTEEVIQKHLNLLAKGGRLIIIIPNLRGINYYLVWLFHKEVIAIHNIEIMQKNVFLNLFENKGVRKVFGDYNGVFNFYLFNTKESSPMRYVLKFCFRIQLILNAIFHLFLKNSRVEHKWLSPALIFIGIKEGVR